MTVVEFLYVLCVALLSLYGFNSLVLTWLFYKDYREKMELKEYDRGREMIEKTKDDVIQDTAPEKEQDIPYKSKIETPKAGSSDKKK